MSVEKLIEDLMIIEGGYVDHPYDRGGPTKYGITHITLAAYLGRSVNHEEVRNLDESTAKDIYRSVYYFAPGIDKLPVEVQPIIFDMCVNHGPRNAIKMVQKTLNATGQVKVDIDGANGPQTEYAIKRVYKLMGEFFINALVDTRNNFYRSIVARNGQQRAFLDGWLNRSESFRVEVQNG